MLSNNYYYDRDGRRQNMPDMSVYSATAAKAITAGGDKRCSSSLTHPIDRLQIPKDFVFDDLLTKRR